MGIKNRSGTPVPKSKFTLSNNFSMNNPKRMAKSPNRINLSPISSPFNNRNNNLSKKIKTSQNKNFSLGFPNNNFKGKNIFKKGIKQKPTTKEITMNINQGDNLVNISTNSTSSPNSNFKLNKTNNTVSNRQQNDSKQCDNGSSSNYQNIQVNESTNMSKFIQMNNDNLTLSQPIIDPICQKLGPTVVKKRIRCMHDLSKTGYAGEEEKKVNQDIFFNFRNFSNNDKYYFMGVW